MLGEYSHWGVYDGKVAQLASNSSYDKHGRNVSRNLHVFIHRKKKTFPVKIDAVETPIRSTARGKKMNVAQWPVMYLSEWMKAAFKDSSEGAFFLGGYLLSESLPAITSMLTEFWDHHQYVDATPARDPGRTIPIYIHGDEGRGQVKRPVMVCSFQPCIGWDYNGQLNSKKNLTWYLWLNLRFSFSPGMK